MKRENRVVFFVRRTPLVIGDASRDVIICHSRVRQTTDSDNIWPINAVGGPQARRCDLCHKQSQHTVIYRTMVRWTKMNIKNLSRKNLDFVLEYYNSPLDFWLHAYLAEEIWLRIGPFSQLLDLCDLDLDSGSGYMAYHRTQWPQPIRKILLNLETGGVDLKIPHGYSSETVKHNNTILYNGICYCVFNLVNNRIG